MEAKGDGAALAIGVLVEELERIAELGRIGAHGEHAQVAHEVLLAEAPELGQRREIDHPLEDAALRAEDERDEEEREQPTPEGALGAVADGAVADGLATEEAHQKDPDSPKVGRKGTLGSTVMVPRLRKSPPGATISGFRRL